MENLWNRQRYYQHLDDLCSPEFIKSVSCPEFVTKHSWCPLLYFEKSVKRYKPKLKQTVEKTRPIMFSSHRDAMIQSKYAAELSHKLELFYAENDLSGCVIAYRRLGKANYDFAAEVDRFVRTHIPCCVLCYDFSKFFDTLNHAYLKARLKQLLEQDHLPPDWYSVFKALTKFHFIKMTDLHAIPAFAARMEAGRPKQIASIEQVRSKGVQIHTNTNVFGIPQGTPLSAAASNAYMFDFDLQIHELVKNKGGLYRRYSDDVLMVIPLEARSEIEKDFESLVDQIGLAVNGDKTEINIASRIDDLDFQYLGFNVLPKGASIRSSSCAKQSRKMKYGIRKIGRDGKEAIERGTSDKIFTKRLRRRFVETRGRNFPAYTRRCAAAFGSKRITRQARRIERRAEAHINDF